jgi:hypothetical protein
LKPLNGKFRVNTWNLMYVGAILCALIAVATVYQVTISNDTTMEWIIWLCVIVGFTLFGLGYVYEYRYKKDHPEESEQDHLHTTILPKSA